MRRRDRIRTLVFEAFGYGWPVVLEDTALRGVLRLAEESVWPSRLGFKSLASKLSHKDYEALGYVMDWREALKAHPALDVTLVNVNNLVDYALALTRIRDYDFIVVLHSAAGDSMSILSATSWAFTRRSGTMAMFLGNEHDLLNEKLGFIKTCRPELVCSQYPLKVATWLYSETGAAKVLSLPHALNPEQYRDEAPLQNRPVDVGFIGALYDRIVGDRERTSIIEYFRGNGEELGLLCDIRTNHNIPRVKWNAFLNRCKAIVGAESGTRYLQRDAASVRKAITYIQANPKAGFEESFAHAFAGAKDYIDGKCISSRHFEAAGAGTCQILVRGHYNGVFQEGEHYIPVAPDLSDVDEAIGMFKDPAMRSRVAKQARELALDAHTYAHRVQTLVEAARAV